MSCVHQTVPHGKPMTEQRKEVIVIGAGGFGREVSEWAQDSGLNVVGFADDDPDALQGFNYGLPILGPIEAVQNEESVAFVVAVGEPATRRHLADRLEAVGGSLVSVIHPRAYVAKTAQIGHGCILAPYVQVSADATVGANTALSPFASIWHDAVVGSHCFFCPYGVVTGGVELGDGVFLGTHATVVPRISVGSGTRVAAGAVVTRDVGQGLLMIGMPARGRALFPEN
jgi:sugar O-acyltransferase (sialic acid O-acetyltransferase NeuD family)